MKHEEIIKELTLLLAYLTGWEEDKINSPGKKDFRAWMRYELTALISWKINN